MSDKNVLFFFSCKPVPQFFSDKLKLKEMLTDAYGVILKNMVSFHNLYN